MTNKKPSLPVSVVIPAYNRLDLLQPVLTGFLAQAADQDCELVVVDDGSDPPVEELTRELGEPELIRLIRQPNGGRSAALNTGLDAARGDLVVFCDSDIVPEPGFLREHVEFHTEHPSPLATHLGELVWDGDVGLFGMLMGARNNPRLIGHRGEVDWTLWYTDNWSFKRNLFEQNDLRFDSFFRRWGWEELELARRLQGLGATNTLTGLARGRHLKAPDLDSTLRNFRRSVPNLLYLARQMPGDAQVAEWLDHRFESEQVLEAAEGLLGSAWNRLVELDRLCHSTEGGSQGLVDAAGPILPELAVAFSNTVFGLGIARGLHEETSPADWTGLTPSQPQDTRELLGLTNLLGLLYFAGTILGHEETSFAHLELASRELLTKAGASEPFAQLFWQRTQGSIQRVVSLSGAAG